MVFDIKNTFLELEKSKQLKNKFAQINNQIITYKKLYEDVKSLHLVFEANQLKKGDRILLSTKDDYATSLFLISFLSYGLVTVFVDPEVPEIRAKGVIKKADVKGFVMDEILFEKREIAHSGFQIKVKNETQKKGKLFKNLLKREQANSDPSDLYFPDLLETRNDKIIELPLINENDIAYVIFTSGTSAEPKGIVITHKNLGVHLATLSKVYLLNNTSVIWNNLMLYHADGCIQGPLLTLYNSCTWINPFKFELSKLDLMFFAVYKDQISHFITVPTLLSIMCRFHEGFIDSFKTNEFKFVISVASKLEVSLWEQFEELFDVQIINVYGLTETVAGSLFNSITTNSRKIGTVGKPIDCEIKITDKNKKLVNDGEEGLLWLKGDHLFENYFKNSDATNLVFDDNWFNTGDIALKDSEGFIDIVGRQKNMINTGGINIYPEQITEIINTHPDVIESICLGIPDESFGEKLISAVAVKNESLLDKLALISFIRPQLEQNQIPKEIYFFEQLPKGLSGKIQQNEIFDLIHNYEKKQESKSVNSFQAVIFKSAVEAFDIPLESLKMSDNSSSIDGWDSMGHLLFITEIEKNLDIKLTTSEIISINNFYSVETILQNKNIKF